MPSVEATLHEWSSLLVGQNPLNIVALTEDITNRLPWNGDPVFRTAIAAINMALYDIADKAWGVYCGSTIFRTPEEAKAEAHRSMELGYAGIKGNPLEDRT